MGANEGYPTTQKSTLAINANTSVDTTQNFFGTKSSGVCLNEPDLTIEAKREVAPACNTTFNTKVTDARPCEEDSYGYYTKLAAIETIVGPSHSMLPNLNIRQIII